MLLSKVFGSQLSAKERAPLPDWRFPLLQLTTIVRYSLAVVTMQKGLTTLMFFELSSTVIDKLNRMYL